MRFSKSQALALTLISFSISTFPDRPYGQIAFKEKSEGVCVMAFYLTESEIPNAKAKIAKLENFESEQTSTDFFKVCKKDGKNVYIFYSLFFGVGKEVTELTFTYLLEEKKSGKKLAENKLSVKMGLDHFDESQKWD
jgi:hypothetical protein